MFIDGDITQGLFRKRRLLQLLLGENKEKGSEVMPEIVKKYAQGIAKRTGLPLDVVLRSQPVQNYKKAILN